MGLISTTLLEFTALWIQTPSGIDFLIAKTMSTTWLEQCQVVISNKAGHTIYTGRSPLYPDGKLLVCPKECNQQLAWKRGRKHVRVECKGCRLRCSVPHAAGDRQSVLGRRDIMKAVYPLERYVAKWEEPHEWQQASGQPAILASRSASLPVRLSSVETSSSSSLPPLDVPPRSCHRTRVQSMSPPDPEVPTKSSPRDEILPKPTLHVDIPPKPPTHINVPSMSPPVVRASSIPSLEEISSIFGARPAASRPLSVLLPDTIKPRKRKSPEEPFEPKRRKIGLVNYPP